MMTFERLYDRTTVLTDGEIEELRRKCYEIGCSIYPVDAFFNDIDKNQTPGYNRNQAYKDLWLIIMDKEAEMS